VKFGKYLVLFILVAVISILVRLFLISRVMPRDVSFYDWRTIITASIVAMIIVVSGMFFLYVKRGFNLVRLEIYGDVHMLRKPWIGFLITTFLIQFAVSSIIGLAITRSRSLSGNSQILFSALIEGFAAIVVFWIFSFILSLPPKVKYIPWGKPLRRK